MVGFGSSLRLARRPGWEGAYFDYEALKLLLSHIEAIYEEGTHMMTNSTNHHHSRHHHNATTQDTSIVHSWDADDLYMNTVTNASTSAGDHIRATTSKKKKKRLLQQRRRRQQQRNREGINHHWNGLEEETDEHGSNQNDNAVRDYKVDLFLESDSDKAYISVDDPMYDTEYDDDEESLNTDEDQNHNNIDEEGNVGLDEINPKPFSLPTTHQYYDEYNSDDDVIVAQQKKSNYINSCWGGSENNTKNYKSAVTAVSTATNTTAAIATTSIVGVVGSTKKNKPTPHGVRRRSSSSQRFGTNNNGGGSSSLVLPSGSSGRNTFSMGTIKDNDTDLALQDQPNQRQSYFDMFRQQDQQQPQPITPPWKGYYGGGAASGSSSHNYYQDSLYYLPPVADEATALLQAPTLQISTPTSMSNGNKDTSVSPPTSTYYWNQKSNADATVPDVNVANLDINRRSTLSTTAMVIPETATKKKARQQLTKKELANEMQRREERKRRRRQKVQKLRQQREKRVPRHIRIAHMKARAITERFLGLLRAETEKVLLFAQSRLGELADTAGSLRFPSYDEEYASNHPSKISSNMQQHGTSGGHDDYEFGDGGMRPSASSSSEDQYAGGGRQRPYHQQQWFTDSSDEENNDDQHPISTTNMNLLSNTNVHTVLSTTNKSDVPTTNTTKTTRTKEIDHLKYIQRQIAHFTELRKRRGIFQRNEQILGEDMLFLSAVEEVDGYTAVGVELLHTLKYICINLIAVRKICRKHDRLLMNRMLGGYYHRLRNNSRLHYKENNIAGVQTLGGMITQISGDIYEAHPSVLGQRSHYKLVGVYDKKVQDLANSRTVQVVSSCLALSLSEYEVARSRADALTRLNSSVSIDSATLRNEEAETDSTDGDSLYEIPSTTSSISLTRLRYTIMSIFALREVSRSKRDHFMTYLSRMTLSFTGQPVIGEGLDGCSRETLDFLVSYDPDRALLRDASVLFDGLKHNRWTTLPLGEVMIASLATATIEMNVTPEVFALMLPREEENVAYAVSANPGSGTDFWNVVMKRRFSKASPLNNIVVIRNLPPILLRLSRMSLFLYSSNYFISHATAATFVKATGSPASFSAILIGIPNISAIIMSILHCWYGSSHEASILNSGRFPLGAAQGFMVFGALMGAIGNGIHGYAINKSSIMLAIVGRFCLGFASAEILQRELMSNCVPVHVVTESGKLTLSRVAGAAIGIAISTFSAIPIAIQTIDIGKMYSPHTRQLQSSSWLMMCFWFIHLLRVLVSLRIKDNSSVKDQIQEDVKQPDPTTNVHTEASNMSSDSESSSSAVIGTPSSVMFRPSLDTIEPLKSSMVLMEHMNLNNTLPTSSRLDNDTQEIRRSSSRIIARQWRTIRRIRKLLAYHVGIPFTLILYAYTTFSLEIFCTATPFIADRYFAWSGARAGTFLGCILAAAFPINAVCEIFSRRYEERAVIRRALSYSCIGFFVMINWQSMFALAKLFPSLLTDTQGRLNHPYDGKLGVIQYVIGMSIVCTILSALEGASLSLLSKLAPMNLRSILISVGTLSTFVGLIARVLGDAQIVMTDLSHKLINADIVNSLVVPLILASFLMSYFLRKIYFILM